MSATEKLSITAQKIQEAADREDWDALNHFLATLQKNALQHKFSADDKAEITKTLQHLQVAMTHAHRRREEIRNLVNQIGSTPL